MGEQTDVGFDEATKKEILKEAGHVEPEKVKASAAGFAEKAINSMGADQAKRMSAAVSGMLDIVMEMEYEKDGDWLKALERAYLVIKAGAPPHKKGAPDDNLGSLTVKLSLLEAMARILKTEAWPLIKKEDE